MSRPLQPLPDLSPTTAAAFVGAITPWEDSRSLTWLTRSNANRPFLKLSRFYEAQADKFMCGPASIAIVLNALRLGVRDGLPLDTQHETFARQQARALPVEYHASFARYTQRNIFGPQTFELKTLEQVYGASRGSRPVGFGLNLSEIQGLFAAHGAQAQLCEVRAEDPRDTHIQNLQHALNSEGLYVVANFDRAVWGVAGGGHVSPIAAYDYASRRILVLDVNMCGCWVWVDVDLFVRSMATYDENQPRGYVIVSESASKA